MTDFFDYTCDRCGSPFCERVQIMNLALDHVEEMYCLNCLAEDQGISPQELAASLKDYIHTRECFQTPWKKFNVSNCPKLEEQTCFCQDTH